MYENPVVMVDPKSRDPISAMSTAGKVAYVVLHVQQAMRILHISYALTPYPNRTNYVIRGATPKTQEQ
jgi:hypothetical protein